MVVGRHNDEGIVRLRENSCRTQMAEAFVHIHGQGILEAYSGDECPLVSAKHREDWGIPDPKNLSDEEFRKLRDLIGERAMSVAIFRETRRDVRVALGSEKLATIDAFGARLCPASATARH